MLKIQRTELDGNSQLNEEQVLEVSPLVLAYVGDAVWELFVRTQLVAAVGGVARARDLHSLASASVSAAAQATVARNIAPFLEPDEHDLMRRGRNTRPGHATRSFGPGLYRQSTGFEALLGYLYLTGKHERLDALMRMSFEIAGEASGAETARGDDDDTGDTDGR